MGIAWAVFTALTKALAQVPLLWVSVSLMGLVLPAGPPVMPPSPTPVPLAEQAPEPLIYALVLHTPALQHNGPLGTNTLPDVVFS